MNNYLPEGMLLDTWENQTLISSPEGLARAMEAHIPVEGLVIRCDSAHNLRVQLGKLTGIIPREEAALGVQEGTAREVSILSRVGHPVCVYVQGLEGHGGNICPLLSRRAAQQEAHDALFSRLTPGDILPVTVTHLEQFGAFVDLGRGLNSMIGVEQLSVSRIPHPSARVQVGQTLRALVTEVDHMKSRVNLSHRELLGTWAENAAQFAAGETVPGIVRSIQPYGSFVELTANLSGLCDRQDGLAEGTSVSVCIKSIQPERLKIKLSVVDVLPAPLPSPPLRYFYTGNRLAHWRYAPEECPRAGLPVWDIPLTPSDP